MEVGIKVLLRIIPRLTSKGAGDSRMRAEDQAVRTDLHCKGSSNVAPAEKGKEEKQTN